MSGLFIKSRWPYKPPLSVPIDATHWFCRDLRMFHTMREGYGLTVYDASGNAADGVINGADWDRRSLSFAASSGDRVDLTPADVFINGSLSLSISLTITGRSTDNATIAALSQATSPFQKNWMLRVLESDHGSLPNKVLWSITDSAGTGANATDPDVPTLNQRYIYTGTFNSTTRLMVLYRDGVQVATATPASWAGFTVGDLVGVLGRDPATIGAPGLVIDWVALHARDLSADEAMALAVAENDVYQPRRIFIPTAEAAAPVAISCETVLRGTRTARNNFTAQPRGARRTFNAFQQTARGTRKSIIDSFTQAIRGAANIYNSFAAEIPGRRRFSETFTATLRGARRAILNPFTATLRGRRKISAEFITASLRGVRRIANDSAARFELYVGSGSAPDVTGTPDATSATIPVSVSSLPADATYYAVTLQRNRFGVRWPIGKMEIITVDANGDQVIAAPTAPTFTAQAIAGGKVRIRAEYPWENEPTAVVANQWLIYTAEGEDPDPGTDTPVVVAHDRLSAEERLVYDTDAFSGEPTMHVLVRVRRSGDSVSSINTTAVTVGAGADDALASDGKTFLGQQARQD